jgi:hypothetical protein
MANIRYNIVCSLVIYLVIAISAECLDNLSADVDIYQIEKDAIKGIDNRYVDKIIDNNIIIADLLVKAPIDFRNCTFRGIISFNNCTFDERVTFSDCIFDGRIAFNDCTFNKESTFRESIFKNDSSFKLSKFRKSAAFDGTVFIQDSDFGSTSFSGVANFGYSRFICSRDIDTANFSNATFEGDALFFDSTLCRASFWDTKFMGDMDFRRAKFLMKTYFQWTKEFSSRAMFGGSIFYKKAYFSRMNFKFIDFSGARFKEYAYFLNSDFTGRTTFKDSEFNQGADFSGCIFGGNDRIDFYQSKFFNQTAKFEWTKFNNVVDFANANFDDNASFYFAEFNNYAIFENTKFNKCLNFNKTKYAPGTLYLDWDNVGCLYFNQTAYQSLIDNFKKLGLLQDVNDCYYDFKKDELSIVEEDILTKTFKFGAMYLYGFGVKPDYPLEWSMILMGLFSIIWFFLGYSKSELMETINAIQVDGFQCSNEEMKKAPQCSSKKGSLSTDNSIVFSIAVFLSGTKFFIDPPDIPESKKRMSPYIANAVFIVERALGAIFSVLFFYALSKSIVGSA